MNTLFDFTEKCSIITDEIYSEYKSPQDLFSIFTKIPKEIYVVSGPGFYTGKRKALAIAKGLTNKIYGICRLGDFLSLFQKKCFFVERDKIVYLLDEKIKIYTFPHFSKLFSEEKLIGNENYGNENWTKIDCSTQNIYANLNKFSKKKADQYYYDDFIYSPSK